MPAPFAPMSATVSPASTRSVIAEERLEVAVERVERLNVKQRHRRGIPCRSPRTSRLVITSAGGPSSTLRPKWSTMMRSATARSA